MIENSEIIKATKELTMMIEQHPITKSYILSNKKLAEDNDAAKLMERLITTGQELQTKVDNNEVIDTTKSAEYELLRKDLNSNIFIKSHLQLQRDYLQLISSVMEKIQKPE